MTPPPLLENILGQPDSLRSVAEYQFGEGLAALELAASTLRDAHVRDFSCILLEDGCAAFSEETHQANVAALRSVADVMTCADFVGALRKR